MLDKALQGEQTTSFEIELKCKDGSNNGNPNSTGDVVLVLMNATPRHDFRGQITGVVGIGQDITVLRKV